MSGEPTLVMSGEPTLVMSGEPTLVMSDVPSSFKVTTNVPSFAPTTKSPTSTSAIKTNNVLDADTKMTYVGATNKPRRLSEIADGSTNKFTIIFEEGSTPGFKAVPINSMTIVKGIRFYASNSSKGRDPVMYQLEGRKDGSNKWETIASGDMEFPKTRNKQGLPINSSFSSGDDSLSYFEDNFDDNDAVYSEYQVLFQKRRSGSSLKVSLSEVELRGFIIVPPPAPTPPITDAPTPKITDAPTPEVTDAPTPKITDAPTPEVTDAPTRGGIGSLVNNVLDADTVYTYINASNEAKVPTNISNGITDRELITPNYNAGTPGLIAKPTQESIVHKVRFYNSNNCKGCDPRSFTLEGRSSDNDIWKFIAEGDCSTSRKRNSSGQVINSTYDSGDLELKFCEFVFENKSVYWQYRMFFTKTREELASAVGIGELELVGVGNMSA
uniref:F5/8 type C domain-containing protein n=1 Tax=Chaetoceros debilis TaxID=122233 RepID=A0A7S3QCB6_9STRA